MLGYFSQTSSTSRKTVRFQERTDNVQGQLSQHIFTPNESYCVYYPSNIFRNTRGFEDWGIFNNYPAKSRGISSDNYPTRP